MEIDPNYPLALALLALGNVWRAAQFFYTPTESELAEYIRMARDAARLASDDPEVLIYARNVIIGSGDIQEALALIRRSIALNANSAEAWATSGLARAFLGDTDATILSNPGG